MGRGKLTAEEIQILNANPNIATVNGNRIVYTDEFKYHFMHEYLAGKGPTQIFREAGLMPELLGSKRIERATDRWKESYFAGSLGVHKEGTIRHRELINQPGLTREEKKLLVAQQAIRKLHRKQKQIEALQAENEVLRKQLRALLGECAQK